MKMRDEAGKLKKFGQLRSGDGEALTGARAVLNAEERICSFRRGRMTRLILPTSIIAVLKYPQRHMVHTV